MQAAYGLMFYLGKTVLPTHLSPLYPLRPDVNPTAPLYLLCALAVGTVTLVLIRMRKRWPWALVAWTCYVVILSPVLGFVQSGPQLVADRYTYLACLPWALLLGAALCRIPSCRRPVVTVMIGAVLVVLSALTFQQTRVWTNGLTLWDHALSIDPSNYVADVNRGWLQLQGDDLDGALTYFESALRANPQYALAYQDRGFVRHRRGDLQGAIADYTAALQVEPPSPHAYTNRARLRRARGDLTGASEDFGKALQVAPADWPYRGQVEHDLQAVRAAVGAGSP